MKRKDRQATVANELVSRIDDFAGEFKLTYIDLLGILGLIYAYYANSALDTHVHDEEE